MFKEYQHIKYLGYDQASDQHRWQYKIIDDDFEEVGVAVAVAVAVGVVVAVAVSVARADAVAVAVVDTYSKRNLPVAPNLIRAMLWFKDKYNCSLDDQVFWYKKYNPRWPEIEKDMRKYLLFS